MAVRARARALRRMPHGPPVDAAPDGAEADARQGTLGMIAGYERPLHSSTLRPARENCESCHWPQAEHHDTSPSTSASPPTEEQRDPTSGSPLHTTANVERETPWKVTGIHWHIANDVEFMTPRTRRRARSLGADTTARRHQGDLHRPRVEADRRRNSASSSRGASSATTATTPSATRSRTRPISSTTRCPRDVSTATFRTPRRAR